MSKKNKSKSKNKNGIFLNQKPQIQEIQSQSSQTSQKGLTITVRLPESLSIPAKSMCNNLGLSMNSLICISLGEYLHNKGIIKLIQKMSE